MKNLPAALKDDFSSASTTKCRLFTMVLPNTTTYRYTDLDSAVLFAGNVYEPHQISVSAIRNTINVGVADASITFLLADEGDFSFDRVRRGALDVFAFRLEAIDYLHPEHGSEVLLVGTGADATFTPNGRLEITVQGTLGSAEINIGEVYSQQCRNEFGDSQCRYDVESTRVEFTIASVDPSNYAFGADELVGFADGHFNFGVVTFTSGDNLGTSVEVAASDDAGVIELALPPPYRMEVGDTGSVVRGCSKELSQCVDDYSNSINYRGEPHVPTVAEQNLAIANQQPDAGSNVAPGETGAGLGVSAAAANFKPGTTIMGYR